MPIASDQDIPERPKDKEEPWSFRKLFPFKASVSSLIKNFNNPYDIIVVFLVLIIGIAELLSIRISLMTYILTISVLAASLVQHRENLVEGNLKKRK